MSLTNQPGQPYLSAVHNGLPKPDALGSVIRSIDPAVNFLAFNEPITRSNIPRIVEQASSLDLEVIAFDDFDLAIELGDAIYEHCPVLFPILYPRADGAEISVTVPGATPRLSQIMGRGSRQRIEGATALGVDVLFCASFAASVALRLLLGDRRGHELFPPVFSDASLYIVGIRNSFVLSGLPQDCLRVVSVVRTT